MNYKEKINEILKNTGFEEKDGKLIRTSPLLTIESSFDENGHWDLCAITRRHNKVDMSVLETMYEYNFLNEKLIAMIFSNIIKNYKDIE